jgi:hypothetical protein
MLSSASTDALATQQKIRWIMNVLFAYRSRATGTLTWQSINKKAIS